MGKLNLEEIKRETIKVFKTKGEALKYIKDFKFKEDEKLILVRINRKWVIMYGKW